MTTTYEHLARERKASAIWATLAAVIPGTYDPTDHQCTLAAGIAGVHPPSAATCDRVREIAGLAERVAS